METNLFVAKPTATTATKKTKEVLTDPTLLDKIKLFNQLKNEIESATAHLKMVEGDIKESGKDIFLKKYQKRRPENFKIADTTGAEVMIIVMDKYSKVDEDKAKGIYKAPTYLNNFEQLYQDVIKTDLYEGVVLKKINSKLSFGLNKKNNTEWQIKIRKPTKIYNF